MVIKSQSISEKNVFSWIENELNPEFCTSEEFIYNEMESQSGYGLPIIYQAFDASKKSHWIDRGSLYDFLYSTKGEGKKAVGFWSRRWLAFTNSCTFCEGSYRSRFI